MSAKSSSRPRARSKSEPRSSSRRRSHSNSTRGRSPVSGTPQVNTSRDKSPTSHVGLLEATLDKDLHKMLLLFVGPHDAGVAALLGSCGYAQRTCDSVEDAEEQLRDESSRWVALVCTLSDSAQVVRLMGVVKRSPSTFTIVFNHDITNDCCLRMRCFDAGARMLANDSDALIHGLKQVGQQFTESGDIACHICGLAGLSENGLHMHVPLYHSMERPAPNPTICPICSCKPSEFDRGNFYLHLHNKHGPPELREPAFPDFSAFTWVVCRRPCDGCFLLVNEPAGLCMGSPRYWLPAGRVDAGETFVEAGVRETLEEGGIQAVVTGVLEFRLGAGIVPRIVLLAEPRENSQAKSVPDFESCGALWVEATALDRLMGSDFRSLDPKRLYADVASGLLCPQPIGTESFAALENMVRKLTLERERSCEEWSREVSTVWEQLLAEYPASCFVME